MRIGKDKLKSREYAVFTPHSVAKSLKREEPDSSKETSRSRSSNASVTVDTSIIAEKILEFGIHLFARRQRKQEERQAKLDQGVLRLARRLNGFLGVPDLLGFEICGEAEGLASLKRLSLSGHCAHLCDYKEDSVYVFPEFIQRVWICEYCDSNFTIEEHDGETCSCSNCSAPMERGIL